MSDEQVTALFHKARAAEYHAIVRGCREVGWQIDRLKSAHRGSVPQVRARLDTLKRELDRVQGIDYLDSPTGKRAKAAWEATAKRLRVLDARPFTGSKGPRGSALPPPGTTWVTRPRPHIDRIASAWLYRCGSLAAPDKDVRNSSVASPPAPLMIKTVSEALSQRRSTS